MSSLPGFSSSSGSAAKNAVMQQIQQEAAIGNARALVTGINTSCYEKCVPKPGTSLSRGEETCMTQCMEKYMAAWNAVSRSYIGRLQQQAQQQGMLTAGAGLGDVTMGS